MQEAAQLLEELLAYIKAMHNTYQEIRILACLALVYQAQGRTKEAQDALEHSLKLAQPGGFIRTFVDLGLKMAELLKQFADQGFETDYIRQILAAFPGQPQIMENKDLRKRSPTMI